MDGVFRSDQALYGYDDGHRLLAASGEVTSSERRTLQRLTDSPDAGRFGDWQSVLAGYPLPSGRFAVTMTWQAPEMPRPGCVWTHVVLLEAEESGVRDWRGLLPLFARPGDPSPDLELYKNRLEWEASDRVTGRLGAQQHEVARIATWALFDPPAKPVRIGGVQLDDAARHELLLVVWGAQWGELRARTSFAESPTARRHVADRPFDLQLHRISRLRHDGDERLITGRPTGRIPTWVESFTSAALKHGPLVDFLAEYGPELPPTRDSVVPLTEIWQAYTEQQDAEATLRALSAAFPSPAKGAKIKSELLNPMQPAAGCLERPSEPELLRAFVGLPSVRAYDVESFDLAERASTLAKTDPDAIGAILPAIKVRETKAATEVLDGLVDSLTGRALEEWVQSSPQGLLPLVSRRPSAARNASLWKTLPSAELWSAVKRLRSTQERTEILKAMLSAGADVDPAEVASAWSMNLVVEALATGRPSKKTKRRWVEALDPAALAPTLVDRDPPDVELIEVALPALRPQDVSRWDPAFVAELLAAATTPSTPAAIFIASLHQTEKPAWADLAIRSFEQLVKFAGTGKLDGARPLFAELEVDLPKRDVKARAARALNRALKDGRWPVTSTLDLTNRSAFTAVVDADRKAGLARRIVNELATNPRPVEPWQEERLRRAIKERADPEGVVAAFENLLAGFFEEVRRRVL